MFRLMHDLHLYDTLIGMILKGATGFGMNFLILYGIFSGVSDTYAEAAKIDGTQAVAKREAVGTVKLSDRELNSIDARSNI